jgi:hypothetical protein
VSRWHFGKRRASGADHEGRLTDQPPTDVTLEAWLKLPRIKEAHATAGITQILANRIAR